MKNKVFFPIIGLLLIICSAKLAAEESAPFVTVTHFSAASESMQGRATSIIQDSEGYIWVSSFNGINRYDGNQWTKYKSRPGKNSVLATNRINNLWENSQGNIWCSTVQDMYVFNKREELFIDIQHILDSLANHKVHIAKVWPLKNGVTWMQDEEGLLFRLNDKTPDKGSQLVNFGADFKNATEILGITLDKQAGEWILASGGTFIYSDGTAERVSKITFRHIAIADNGPWLISTNGCQVAHYEGESLFMADFIPENSHVYSFSLAFDSLLICATDKGLYRMSVESLIPSAISKEKFLHITIDSEKTIWGLTETDDVYRLESDDCFLTIRSKHIELPRDYSVDLARSTFRIDASGLVWLLPYTNSDILFFNKRTDRFERPFCREDIQANTTSRAIDRQGNVWYQSERNVDMFILHNLPFHIDDIFPYQEVRSQFLDSKGRHWYGLRENQVVLCDSAEREIRRFALQGTMYCITETSDGTIWMGSRSDGLYQLKPRESSPDGNDFDIIHYLHDENDITSLSNNSIYSICEDTGGHIWIGTFGGGLNLWNNGQFIHQQNRLGYNSELPQTIRFVTEIKSGTIVIGSREGLYTCSAYFNSPEKLRMFHHTKRSYDSSSLPDNDIMSVIMTHDSILYVSTQSGGICRMTSGDILSDNIQFQTISKDEGLASDVAYCIVEDKEGYLWVSSERALSRLSPDNQTITIYDDFSFPTEVFFSEGSPLKKGEELFFGTMQGTVSVNPSDLHTSIYVPPLVITSQTTSDKDDRSVTIHFSALDFRNRKHIKYKYRLEGIDTEWKTSSENSVTYINLPPGKHKFHVYSTNADGQWTNNEQILPLYVKPHFYETIWGMTLIALAILAVITLGVYEAMRIFRLRHSLTVEQELTDMKLRFFTDISHELRTPLTLVDGPVSEVLADKTLSDQSRYYLEVVQRNVRRMLNLVNQILDFRKLQSHKMSLLIEPIEVKDLLSHIMENFEELATQHHMDFMLKCDDQLPTLWGDRDKIEKIFFNLLVNAFKYTDDGKSITVQAGQPTRNSLSISVIDKGIGIRKEDVEKLFKRFETVLTDNTSKASSGIGLALVKQFADLHHAAVNVDSKVGEGSTFTVTFRTGKEHFSEDSQVEFLATDLKDTPNDIEIPDHQQENGEKVPIGSIDDGAATKEERAKILIVEDNEELRDFMIQILADNYQIATASNGEEGLRIGRELWPDLIITDIMMPVMDGFEMIRRIKDDPDIYAVPIIVLTAKGSLDDRIHGVEMGVDDYVLKPFSSSYLKARTAALLEQRKRLLQRYMKTLSAEKGSIARRNLEPDMPVITPADELFIQDVMAFMEKNMDNPDVTIDDFASAVMLGRTVFYNKLKATVGLTPIDFVQEMRIKRAVQLMKTGNFTISEIAYRTGFNDPKYFSRCFKKHLGETPTEYQKKLKEGKE